MEDVNFKLRSVNTGFFVSKSGLSFGITRDEKRNIWFDSLTPEMNMEIKMLCRNEDELKFYRTLSNLMKSLVGRYVLDGDRNNYLPEDFIDLENKTVVWHSDSRNSSLLRLQYGAKVINLSILKSAENKENNSVVIKSVGSMYDYYGQEFYDFFENLIKNFSNSTEIGDARVKK